MCLGQRVTKSVGPKTFQDFKSVHWSGPPHLSQPCTAHRGGSFAASMGHQAETSQVFSFSLYSTHLPVWIPSGGWGVVRGPKKHKCENHRHIMSSTQARDYLFALFNPSSFNFHETSFEPQSYIRQPNQRMHWTISFFKKRLGENTERPWIAVGFFGFFARKDSERGAKQGVFSCLV